MTHRTHSVIVVGVAKAMTLAPNERDAPDQAHMEALVRRLLRRTGDSYRLASLPLVQALCRATGISNAQLAVRHVIEAAFRNAPHEAELRDLILASDIDAHLTRTESAARLRVSRRHLQRYRAQAVSILATHVRELIGPIALITSEGEQLGDPLDMLAEMISKIEPGMAATLSRFGSPRMAAIADVLDIRSRVEAGREIDDAPALPPGLSRPLFAVFRAQSKQINGKGIEAREALRPVLTGDHRGLVWDAEARFELEWLTFLRARHRGDAHEAWCSASNLRRIAQDRAAWRSRALLAQTESEIRLGRTWEARAILREAERLNLLTSAISQLTSAGALRAEIAFCNGEDELSDRLASGAYVVLRGRHYDAYRCLVTIARARFRLGKRWNAGDNVSELGPCAWDRLNVTIEHARHLTADGLTGPARDCATQAFSACLSLGYRGLASRAAATIGATFTERSGARRAWYLRALSLLIATRDQFNACDLFARTNAQADKLPLGCFDEDVADALYCGLLDSIPHLRTDSERDGRAARDYLMQLGRYVLGLEELPTSLNDAAEAVAARANAFASFVLRFLDDFAAIVRPVFEATVDFRHRTGVASRLNAAIVEFGRRARAHDHQQYMVG
jgi:hypothetical protein